MYIAFFHRGGRVFPAKVGPVPPILAASSKNYIIEMFPSPPLCYFVEWAAFMSRHLLKPGV